MSKLHLSFHPEMQVKVVIFPVNRSDKVLYLQNKEIQKKNENILGITAKDDLEKLEVQTNRFPLLGCRKAFWRVIITI